jgi:hypothetical protein
LYEISTCPKNRNGVTFVTLIYTNTIGFSHFPPVDCKFAMLVCLAAIPNLFFHFLSFHNWRSIRHCVKNSIVFSEVHDYGSFFFHFLSFHNWRSIRHCVKNSIVFSEVHDYGSFFFHFLSFHNWRSVRHCVKNSIVFSEVHDYGSFGPLQDTLKIIKGSENSGLKFLARKKQHWVTSGIVLMLVSFGSLCSGLTLQHSLFREHRLVGCGLVHASCFTEQLSGLQLWFFTLL